MMNEKVFALQFALQEMLRRGTALPGLCIMEHYFSAGVYARKIIIPKHTLLISKVHAAESMSIVSKGRIAVTLDGHPAAILEAGMHLVSPPGIKRAGLAHEMTFWTTIHANPDNEQDLAKLEDRFIVPEAIALADVDMAALEGGLSCLGAQ